MLLDIQINITLYYHYFNLNIIHHHNTGSHLNIIGYRKYSK